MPHFHEHFWIYWGKTPAMISRLLLLTLACLAVSYSTDAQTYTEIAGKTVDAEPWVIFPLSFHANHPMHAAVNPAIQNLDGETVDIYITSDKTADQWDADGSLTDVRSTGAQQVSFSGSGLGDLWVELNNTDELSGIDGARPSVGYDLVIDVNQDGQLDAGDILDGYANAGMYVVSDMNEPGPYAVDSLEYISPSGEWQCFRVYYPENLQSLDAQPLVVISHGWTHSYFYYDHLGTHLASYGYVVMSHKNDVGNGGAAASTTASQSALQNIDTLLTIYPNLSEGILANRIDKMRMVHAGHSTGGECVVRAYNRLYNGDYVSPHITHENIVCVNSLAPVAFLSADETHPQGANYHQFLCAADTDVSGAPVDGYQQALSIYERAYGNKQVTYIHGAGHEDLNNDGGDSWAQGPDLIGREATHEVMRPYFLALCELYTRNSLGMKDFFTRNKKEFRPPNIEESTILSGEYRDAMSIGNVVIDDFESEDDLGTSSSGGIVNSTLAEHHEVHMQDLDGTFNWLGDSWSNGMTRARYDDDPHCATFAWEENAQIDYEIVENISDWTSADYLSFRTCQMTRHPLNESKGVTEDINFTVMLTDVEGVSSPLTLSAYGEIAAPYPRGAGQEGTGGIIEACLEEGTYTVLCGGSQWESEMSFEIVGYLGGGAGEYEFEIGAGDPCTDIEIFLYDSWGDGWDDGGLQIISSGGDIVVEGTLEDGFGPNTGVGWQNEFYTIRIRLTDFQANMSGLDLSNIVALSFLFGGENGTADGALGLDDIELVSDGLSFTTDVEELVALQESELAIYPNPVYDLAYVVFDSQEHWSYQVHNTQGRLVYEQGNISGGHVVFDRNELASGIYTVTVFDSFQRKTGVIMLE